ncbi:P22 phage major capsid protein family protein [Mycetocola zhadangensis]|uniref:Uncharacterized protein n=1 Tax=Mycetocola zhadangensis TaxID=1164595 RepID=A0A3L7J5T5_9MICO|nr:P22 phage major capsid protein family protein [Mycetocola zhadangensis]RLQ85870.1 hypothetical protein D9V28_03165 [Mycetocola zhadangensis]GGE86560.1 hypothetical protein GCM10011313_06220 [Mycetocola zhadangensis]
MSNTFTTASDLATVAAKIVGLDLNLAGHVYRDVAADFSSGQGSTVRIPVPGAVKTNTISIYNTTVPLVASELNEQGIDVTLSTHAYSRVPLADGHLDLDITDLARQVLAPQAQSIVRYVETEVAAALTATPETTSITYDPANPARSFTAIRRKLRDNGVKADAPMIAAVGSDVFADLLDGPTGSAGTTFDANGKVRGFTVVESTRLAPGEIVGFIKEAFALVVRAPRVPDGASFGHSVTTQNDDGTSFAVRYIRDFDSALAIDTSLVSAYVAAQALPLAVDREDGTVALVENGGAIRVLTAA